MRNSLAVSLCLSLSMMYGCTSSPSTEDNGVDVSVAPSENRSPVVTREFQDAAFGDPWSLDAGWIPGTSGGAAYLAGGPKHVVRKNGVALVPPPVDPATYFRDYQAWYAYCSGALTADDPRLGLVTTSMTPYPRRDDCFVLP